MDDLWGGPRTEPGRGSRSQCLPPADRSRIDSTFAQEVLDEWVVEHGDEVDEARRAKGEQVGRRVG